MSHDWYRQDCEKDISADTKLHGHIEKSGGGRGGGGQINEGGALTIPNLQCENRGGGR